MISGPFSRAPAAEMPHSGSLIMRGLKRERRGWAGDGSNKYFIHKKPFSYNDRHFGKNHGRSTIILFRKED